MKSDCIGAKWKERTVKWRKQEVVQVHQRWKRNQMGELTGDDDAARSKKESQELKGLGKTEWSTERLKDKFYPPIKMKT